MGCDESLVKAQTLTQTHTDWPHQDQEELNLYAGRDGRDKGILEFLLCYSWSFLN